MRQRAPHQATRVGAIVLVAVIGFGPLAACGSDGSKSTTPTTQSPQDAYCQAGTKLRTDVKALGNLDLVAEGTNGLTAAVDAVKSDITQLRDAASSATSAPIDELETSIDELSTTVSSLSGGISASSLPDLKTAITNVASSATAVYDTLKDCP